ncbi:MAG TPA: LytTR family DNA-binding domain-containing protein [Puia sp.]|uniref:LytR/AlgR family response regulator transcription factor n=1 Tax=Puia sp. TaxID=2045100 RepID=UPI002C02B449|nr:LytTR family DNA-binding domain-containing protein [Puia sp.]HVU94524.1 LytTR family DNA-binding domain-containing protein [Puia sp.]
MKLRCLIVDDEPPSQKILQTYLESTDNLLLTGTCNNALEAMQFLKQHPVDLLFLDINMPRLLGTELIRTLRHPPKVIFTTAHKDYAHEGFDLDAVDYLLKPYSFERFLRAVNKLAYTAPVAPEKTEEQNPAAEPFLYFRVDRKMVRVRLDEIVYIESLKDYSKVVLVEKKPLIMKKSISTIEEMLPPHLFLRIHRSFIISVNKVTAFTQNDVEISGQELPIGKLYRHQLAKLTLSSQQASPISPRSSR